MWIALLIAMLSNYCGKSECDCGCKESQSCRCAMP